MSLPFLPGNSVNRHLSKVSFHKAQHCSVSNGVPLLVGGAQKLKPKYSVYPEGGGGASHEGEGGASPSWVAFDKQVLSFDAFFEENEPLNAPHTRRIRKCRIYFYPEDDTVKVVEPESKNSGIAQGTLIRRHRVPLPPPDDDSFYTVFHFNVDQQVELYSRTFTITGCDGFTRNFLNRLGVVLNPPTAAPPDPHTRLRQQMEGNMKPLRPYHKHDSLRQFLQHDRQVLRFYCVWLHPEGPGGPGGPEGPGGPVGGSRDPLGGSCDHRELVLHYFLSDDTVEIRESVPPNAGRDHVSKFLHRCRLPKRVDDLIQQPGQKTDRSVLNVLETRGRGQRYLLDSLRTGVVQEEFYHDSDLTVGGDVNVFGRTMLIVDCDDFTKDYYRSRYGIEDFSPVPYKRPVAPRPPRPPPPYNGFGSEEDSLSSCKGLLPKSPQKDFHKFMQKDRCGQQSHVLNFRARLDSEEPLDRDRTFIISFFLSDDSIAVYEKTLRNSGIMGGKFLERGRVKKPGQGVFKSEPSEYFQAQDFYVGASLSLNKQKFLLLEADEYTLGYMEGHANEFPRSNVGMILSKLRSVPEDKRTEIRKFLSLSDANDRGYIPEYTFRTLLSDLDCGLSDHEVLVLCRVLSAPPVCDQQRELTVAAAQELMRRNLFEEFEALKRSLQHRDPHRCGRLSVSEVRTVCKACRLPISDSLLSALIQQFADGDQVDYHAFMDAINWLENPAPPLSPEDTAKLDLNLKCDVGGVSVKNIEYTSLLHDVFNGSSGNMDATTSA